MLLLLENGAMEKKESFLFVIEQSRFGTGFVDSNVCVVCAGEILTFDFIVSFWYVICI